MTSSVKYDKQKNLVIITLRDNFDKQQGDFLCRKLEAGLAKVKKNFMVLTDLTGLESFESSSYKYIQKMMALCNSSGVSKIFRVIPDETKDIGFNIMSMFHYSKDVRIHTYKTLEEAQYHVRMSSDITFIEKALTLLKIANIKIQGISKSIAFRFLVIAAGFILLVILRQIFEAFGISLGYLYITLISLTGFWFGIRGGLISALTASLIFVLEVTLFKAWPLRNIVLSTMLVRFAIYFLSGLVIGYLSQSEKNTRRKLEFLAGHDELTSTFNFKFIVMLLNKEFERSKRYGKNLTIALLDIDDFKKINDAHGHLVGNDMLKAFSNIIKYNLRETDTIGRYGGDEFLLIFPESTAGQALNIMERIKATVYSTKMTSSFLLNKDAVSLKFSAGIASFSKATTAMNNLVDNADKALYRAKKEGKDRTLVY